MELYTVDFGLLMTVGATGRLNIVRHVLATFPARIHSAKK
jgi:hypothetical protein